MSSIERDQAGEPVPADSAVLGPCGLHPVVLAALLLVGLVLVLLTMFLG